ncbi:MAG: hypothetical protein ACLFUL_07605 [Desulfobacteraceae bacterium]
MQIIPAPQVLQDPYDTTGTQQTVLRAMLEKIFQEQQQDQQREQLASMRPLLQTALGAQRRGEPGQAIPDMIEAASEMKDPFAIQSAMELAPMFEQRREEKQKFEAWSPKGDKRIFYQTPTQIEALQAKLAPKGWKFSKPEKPEEPEAVTMFRERQDGTWIERNVKPETARRLEKQGWQYGERKGSTGENLETFEAKEKIKAKYRHEAGTPTPQQALRRVSDIKRAMATLDKTNEITSLIVAANPELESMLGQKMDEERKQELMDAWQNELDYLNDFVPAGSRKAAQPNYEYIPGKGLMEVE